MIILYEGEAPANTEAAAEPTNETIENSGTASTTEDTPPVDNGSTEEVDKW
jgi:hypothetical protein